VVANILSGPLIRMSSTLTGLVQPRGTLILSGVLSSQVDSVSRAYQVHGLKEPRIKHLGEWSSLMWAGECMK
jgi:ribosomal protein L11 methyltransferase